MKKLVLGIVCCSLLLIPIMAFAFPSVYATGTTIFDREKSWSGYTVLSKVVRPEVLAEVRLLDMNGNIVHTWNTIAMPAKVMPGGHIIGSDTFFASSLEVRQYDWDGNIVWSFPNTRQHHDYQREGNPVGYYAPGLDPLIDSGKTLILNQNDEGSVLITIVNWEGEILWEWVGNDHIDEIKPGSRLDVNTASWLGTNRWYDAGDERFHPDNIICGNQYGDTIFIISRATGAVVWKVGPDYTDAPQLKRLDLGPESGNPENGQFIGGMLHHAHMIPQGLPGEGNILVFNNGSPFSIVTEFDPTTLAVVWEYSGEALGYTQSRSLAHSFASPTAGSAQRLLNGNTLITESDTGRIFEVTENLETVWEYISPFAEFSPRPDKKKTPSIYRAYRVPYDWVPQLAKPTEVSVTPPRYGEFTIEAMMTTPDRLDTSGAKGLLSWDGTNINLDVLNLINPPFAEPYNLRWVFNPETKVFEFEWVSPDVLPDSAGLLPFYNGEQYDFSRSLITFNDHFMTVSNIRRFTKEFFPDYRKFSGTFSFCWELSDGFDWTFVSPPGWQE